MHGAPPPKSSYAFKSRQTPRGHSAPSKLPQSERTFYRRGRSAGKQLKCAHAGCFVSPWRDHRRRRFFQPFPAVISLFLPPPLPSFSIPLPPFLCLNLSSHHGRRPTLKGQIHNAMKRDRSPQKYIIKFRYLRR